MKPRRFAGAAGPGTGPEARLKKIRRVVTALIRHERIESTFAKCDEARGYAERLIQIAIKNGDTHRETMDMADYWLEEKDLVHKLFKVLVPRYGPLYDKESFTAMWRLPNKLPGDGQGMSLLELKGNPWPPIQPKQRDTKFLLTNILLEEFKKDYNSQKKISQSTKEISEKTNISKQEVEEIDSNNNASDSVHNKDTDRRT
ncbi:hypothetical protein ScPMuIL_003352 [Solemya velum]